ncbi:MAG: hypothetical protein ACRDJY_04715 [Thermoleophilaceae bacterium]
MATRLASLAAIAAAAFALSGCHEMFHFGFDVDPTDPPLGGHDIGGSPGSAGTSAGQRFTGRADGQLASRMRIRHGNVKTRTSNARFIGDYTSSLEDSPLASAQWHGRFKGVRNRATGRFRTGGLVLATFDDATAGRACLRLRYRGRRAQNQRPRKRGRGVFTMLGGEGGARTLYGKAIVRVKLTRANKLRFRGGVTQSQGAERGFTPACTRLERKFGLTPLAD